MKRKAHEDRLNAFFDVLQGELNELRPKSPSQGFAVERQRTRSRKKAKFHKSDLQVQAVEGFIDDNTFARDHMLNLSSSELSNARHFITTVLERYTTKLEPDCIQLPLSPFILADSWRHGPGASHEVTGTHTAVKMYQKWSCTSLSEPLIRTLRRCNPYLHSYDVKNGNSGTHVVRGSRLATVLKNETSLRTIAIEPSGNMVLQLAAGSYLEGALRSIGLDIRNQQQRNRLLARLGSIGGNTCTIDLKSASNLQSVSLVRSLMPHQWSTLIDMIRSPEIKLPGDRWIELHMVSSMGNGFTFPLMTLLICSLIYALRCDRGGPNLRIDWEYTGVFGDDIIVPVEEYQPLVDLLSRAGYVVNNDKSFWQGPFRESCGGDYWNGFDVSPFYVTSLETDADIYVTINKVLDWCAKVKLSLHQTLLWLKGLIGDRECFLVPEWRGPDEGIRTMGCPRKYKYLKSKQKYVRLRDPHFAVMLASGGYLESRGKYEQWYLPRPHKQGKVVRTSRLPSCYLDGSDPVSRDTEASLFIMNMVQIIFV